jgi:hypothetical protein
VLQFLPPGHPSAGIPSEKFQSAFPDRFLHAVETRQDGRQDGIEEAQGVAREVVNLIGFLAWPEGRRQFHFRHDQLGHILRVLVIPNGLLPNPLHWVNHGPAEASIRYESPMPGWSVVFDFPAAMNRGSEIVTIEFVPPGEESRGTPADQIVSPWSSQRIEGDMGGVQAGAA